MGFVPFYLHSLPIVCRLPVTYHRKRVLTHPKTKNPSRKIIEYIYIKILTNMLPWNGSYVLEQCDLYNSINTSYTTTYPTSYLSFNPTFYPGQNKIPRPGISSDSL